MAHGCECAGADKIQRETRSSSEDKEIPGGEYALFTIPTASEWTIILSKDAKVQSAADYKQENDAARITVKPDVMPMTIETFTIALTDVKGTSATLNFIWDKTRVPVKLTTDDIQQVAKQLEAAAASERLHSIRASPTRRRAFTTTSTAT